MIIYHPEPTYEKEYHEAIAKRDERIPVYKDYCIGDVVYYNGRSEAVIWEDNSIFYFYIIFKNGYHTRIIDKEHIDDFITREKDPGFVSYVFKAKKD